MFSFCDFLFHEGFYERCLISSFQFLYRLPDDPIKPALLYFIARSYEEMQNYAVSDSLFYKILNKDKSNKYSYLCELGKS